MSAEVQQQSARAVFRMNPDFWQQARGPPALPPAPNLGHSSAAVGNAASGNGAAAGAGPGPTQGAGPGAGATGGNNGPTPGVNNDPSNQLVNVPGGGGGGGGPASPDSKMMTEKLVNELQLSRSNSAISDRTLEECWSTLQRVSWHLFRCIFMHKSAMQMHARDVVHRSEVKPHQCQQCLKSFSSNHQLVQHIRVHTGEKPYKCSYCDRRFKQLSHVQQHTRLHTGERPYKCHLPECGRAFIQLSNLQQHLRNHDAQVERAKNRPFHCNICGKGFATESSLRTHTSKVGTQHAALIGGPNATSCPICHKLFLGGEALMEHMKHTHKDPNASGVANPYLAKRRTANHPCPVCGKHYVNEGSLRKHLACHPETSQLTTSFRMWPCSVCQAVFTHESGLLSHMEHMRMDPKHQFAAQYVLSRAAAERRERESLLAAAVAASSAGGLAGLSGGGGPSSMCASPSAHSDSSSGGGRLSSTGSEPGGIMNNNNNNNNNNNKLGDILGGRGSNNGMHQQYGAEDLHNASRMAAMAAIVGQSSAGVSGGLGSPSSGAVAVQAAAVNLAAAMRMGASGLGGVSSPGGNNGNNSSAGGPGTSSTPPASGDGGVSAAQAQAAMNAARRAASMADSMRAASMADSMRSMDVAMRSSMVVDSAMRLDSMAGHHHGGHQSHHNHQQSSSEAAALRMHQAEALLRSQAEAALRLAVSQAAAVAASSNNSASGSADGNSSLRHHNMGSAAHNGGSNNGSGMNHHHAHHNQVSPDLSEALRLQEQRLEQALRLHGGDPRTLGFPLSSGSSGNSQSQQQNNNP
ncbi:uncharacterized protein [Anabrus simplex]|uniref:uncharacterized protein n=1 Tax=Anabrus simplex TaxID=316456 RepID=UPI0034DD73A7